MCALIGLRMQCNVQASIVACRPVRSKQRMHTHLHSALPSRTSTAMPSITYHTHSLRNPCRQGEGRHPGEGDKMRGGGKAHPGGTGLQNGHGKANPIATLSSSQTQALSGHLFEGEERGGLCSLCPPRARQQSSCLRREASSFQAQDPRAQHCIHDMPYQRDGDSIPHCCVNCSV